MAFPVLIQTRAFFFSRTRPDAQSFQPKTSFSIIVSTAIIKAYGCTPRVLKNRIPLLVMGLDGGASRRQNLPR
jgi:hypothetical protein